MTDARLFFALCAALMTLGNGCGPDVASPPTEGMCAPADCAECAECTAERTWQPDDAPACETTCQGAGGSVGATSGGSVDIATGRSAGDTLGMADTTAQDTIEGAGGATASVDPAGGPGGSESSETPPRAYVDPGTLPWELVPRDQVGEECHLDPVVLESIEIGKPWLLVRYGKLCWAGGGALSDAPGQNFSATKTLGAATLGILAYRTRDLPRDGRKTGPISDEDRVDHWLDPLQFTYNQDAQIAHVLGMEAHNWSLDYGQKKQSYDTIGSAQINSLSTVMKVAIQQDPERLGASLDEFVQRYVFGPLGMTSSTWDTNDLSGLTGWHSTVGDMARLGLLLLNGGMWNGERLLSAEWVYRMTHPSFEDGNTAYGYLTWLNARANWHLAGIELFALGRFTDNTHPLVDCAPAAIHREYPHGLSRAPDCGYAPHADCDQEFDVGVWQANGLGGQLIVGMPGLDMLMVTRDFASVTGEGLVTMGDDAWEQILPAVVAYDPVYQGDVAGFCEAYAANRHAPDLR